MSTAEGAPSPPSRIYVIEVGDREYAVSARAVDTVRDGGELQPLRYAGDSLVGAVDVDGRESLVFDLHWRLGVARSQALDACQLVVTGGRGQRRVYAVGQVHGPVRVHPGAFEPLAPDGVPAQLGYLRGLLQHDGRQLPWLDLDLLGPKGRRQHAA
ncbi:MAG: chemotaxis protein CheW [Dehalococcoidia bacterium]|nr:chemotaxis protein CheW [Dehalococcoidia bacterium]